MEPEALDPAAILATLAILGTLTKGLVDALRRHYPRLQGFGVQLVAAGLGALQAWGFDLRGTEAMVELAGATVGRIPPAPVDYLLTGAAIAAGAGFLAELSGKSGQATPVIVEVDNTGRHL